MSSDFSDATTHQPGNGERYMRIAGPRRGSYAYCIYELHVRLVHSCQRPISHKEYEGSWAAYSIPFGSYCPVTRITSSTLLVPSTGRRCSSYFVYRTVCLARDEILVMQTSTEYGAQSPVGAMTAHLMITTRDCIGFHQQE